jgi:hypothetical protein
MVSRPAKVVTFEQYNAEIEKLMKLLKELGIDIPENAPLRLEEQKAFQFLYYSLFAAERPAQYDAQQEARIQAGLGDLATKINKANLHPASKVLRPHIANMIRGAVRMNDASIITDDAANKSCELYVGCLALGRGWPIDLDDPYESSGGANPDVILNRGGQRWSVAVKTIHGASSQTIFDNIQSAIRQIERSKTPGIVFINLKNRLNQAPLLPVGLVYNGVEDANRHLEMRMLEIINKLRAEIVDEEWLDAFKDKLARPLVAFMGQTLATALVAPSQQLFVPVRFLMMLPVPPLSRVPVLHGLDQFAWDLVAELNHELQAVPGQGMNS